MSMKHRDFEYDGMEELAEIEYELESELEDDEDLTGQELFDALESEGYTVHEDDPVGVSRKPGDRHEPAIEKAGYRVEGADEEYILNVEWTDGEMTDYWFRK